MLPQLISRSPDLKQLADDGYELSITGGQLVVSNVPYVSKDKTVKRAALVSELTLNGDKTLPPSTHVIKFTGEQPCDQNGKQLANMVHSSANEAIGEGIIATRSFSCKPAGGQKYLDYCQKITTYVAMMSVHAEQIAPGSTARTYAVTEIDEPDTPFKYLDNASGLSGISEMTDRVAGQKVGIIGLGGTGSYLLDLVAKTAVGEIHLFDGDELIQHNAFRCPGSVSVETLRKRPKKVEYYVDVYATFRKGLIAHPEFITERNLADLNSLDFVFLCIDSGCAKQAIVDHLEAKEKSFIDVGMGIEATEGALRGIIRTTSSTPEDREQFRRSVHFSEGTEDNAYTRNIQVAELNALNACLAVIKWKKINGIYADLECEMNSNYTVDGNCISND